MDSTHFALEPAMVKEEFRVLNALEISMRKFEWVPLTNICFYARYDPEETRHWIDKVHKHDLIIRKSGKSQERYVLNSKGYDLLALHALAGQGVIAAIGNALGTGKESDVYQATGKHGERLAVKFHRIGRTSFRDVRRKRDYAEGKYHMSWLYMCRLSATREASNLQAAIDAGVAAPELVGHNRHAIVMKQYDGQEIHEFPQGSIANPGAVFETIMNNISLTYRGAGLVHADLGENNILYTATGDVVIIDWPQAVPVTHPNAAALLHRDVENTCTFFRKLGVDADVDELVRRIAGGQ